jgi:hypothetical protein
VCGELLICAENQQFATHRKWLAGKPTGNAVGQFALADNCRGDHPAQLV